MRGTPWTHEEDEMLRRGDVPPWRSKNAATHRRKVLGIRPPLRNWTPEEDALVIKGLMVPGRTSGACDRRRMRLGVTTKRKKLWRRKPTPDPTPEEIKARARLIREARLAKGQIQ